MNEILDELKGIFGSNFSASQTERCCYASDASMEEGMPDYVVRPRSTHEISRLLKYCNEKHVYVTPRGAGTGLAGGASPVRGGIVLDLSGMNKILEIDIKNLQVIVEPGVVYSIIVKIKAN